LININNFKIVCFLKYFSIIMINFKINFFYLNIMVEKNKLKLINTDRLKYPCKEILDVNFVKKYCIKKGIIIITTPPKIK
jgi:hypothetical protein